MNQYEHLIAFEAVGNDTSLHKPYGLHDALQAKPGDSWRWLAPKSIAQGIDERNLKLVLLHAKTGVVTHTIGTLRRQESERYVELTLRVGGLPSEGNWKQFALTRANRIGYLQGATDHQSRVHAGTR